MNFFLAGEEEYDKCYDRYEIKKSFHVAKLKFNR